MNLRDQLKQYIAKEFIVDEHWWDIPDDYDLIRNGILNSFALVQVIVFLETKTGMEFKEDSFNFDQLKSVQDMILFTQRMEEECK
ncbi:hypothetical protein ACFVRA_09660 [Bacillus subtilis]|uniref:hypothetical protein n=1 Tax=Bacillus subtilis group TaxID=653685 RepID=UPI0022E82A2C|nr:MULTISPECIES: hypothetical protein [Bacillus subtilis group]MEC1686920.1 hypothetical protein [Bacillus mojavensis]